MKTTVLIVSGRRLMAEALRALFEEHPDVEACTLATAGETASECFVGDAHGTVVVDLDEIGEARALLGEVLDHSDTRRRVGLYDTFTAQRAQAAFDFGLTALVPLTSTTEQLLQAVLHASPSSSATPAVGLTRQELARLASLTPRETEVLRQIASGRPVAAIAVALGVTVHTVETHRRRCLAKLGVASQSQAVALAAAAGMVTSP